MLRLLKQSLAGLALLVSLNYAGAFSLIGPSTEWHTERLGYDLNVFSALQGPVSIGEEYRWNVPVVFYAFTPDFLNYFGQTGATEVEKAIQILNALPAAEQLNVDDFPLTSQRVNHRAQAINLVDVKSFVLTAMMNQMGLSDPTRFVYTLRNRWIGPGGAPTNYHVIKRNFDPITWQHTSYINGQLWTYPLVTDVDDTHSFVFTEPVDPLALLGLINAPVASGVGNGLLLLGGFWTGMTRDDVGGYRYIYRANNFNVENAPPNATGSGGGGPWGVPTTNTFIDLGLRPGVNKLEFRKANYDSQLGLFEPFTNTYVDKVIESGTTRSQNVQRPLQVADILFDAADLQGGDATQLFVTYGQVFTVWDNNDDVNGVAGQYGPGTFPVAGAAASFVLTLQSVGPTFFNVWPNFLSEQSSGQSFLWGSFDGTTNDPVVYPINTSIEALERQVLGGSNQGDPWNVATGGVTTNVVVGAGGAGTTTP